MARSKSSASSNPKGTTSSKGASRKNHAAGQAEDFLSLWLPFELEIGRLCQSATVAGENEEEERGQLQKRREMLERLFVDAQTKNASAAQAVTAMDAVMNAFGAKVEEIVRVGEWEEGQEPGKVALSLLSNDAEFLKKATFYANALHAWLFESVQTSEKASPKGRGKRTEGLPAIMRFFNDAPHAVTVRGLAQAASWKPSDDFAYAFDHSYADARVVMGLKDEEGAGDLWAYLVKGGPRMVKAHYALWARYYEDVDKGGMRHIMISIPQFCADLGYEPHCNGGFRPEHKREALKMLQALTSIQMVVTKTLRGKERRLRGPLWARGLEAQERDQFGDLFGANRVGNPSSWEPVAFSYSPGPWFDDPEWRNYHRFIGKIGSGLLRLSGHKDQWPILIGGYIGTLGRVSGYQPLRLRVDTILKSLDLAQGADGVRRRAQTRQKLEHALDRLKDPEIGIVSRWTFAHCPEVVEPDMDDANSLTSYGQTDTDPDGPFRGWVVEIELPLEEDAARLEVKRKKARAVGKKRAAAKVVSGSE